MIMLPDVHRDVPGLAHRLRALAAERNALFVEAPRYTRSPVIDAAEARITERNAAALAAAQEAARLRHERVPTELPPAEKLSTTDLLANIDEIAGGSLFKS